MFYLTKKFSFDAAHHIEGHQGQCQHIHGHSWKVELVVSGDDLNSLGMLADFKELRGLAKQVIEAYDHKNLNDVCAFNPTAENLAAFIHSFIKTRLAFLYDPSIVKVVAVRVWESEDSCAEWRDE